MSQWGRYPSFRQFQSALRAKFGSLVSGTGVDQGAGSANFQTLYQNAVRTPQSETSAQSGTTHSPTIADHGKTFYYTNAAGCTVTLPTIASVFEGFRFYTVNLCGGVAEATAPFGNHCTINRSSSDTIDPSGTTFRLPARDGMNRQEMIVINGKWYTKHPRWISQAARTVITFGARLTFAHNVAATPHLNTCWLQARCDTAELGYEAGDIVLFPTIAVQASAAAGFGSNVQADATNVNIDIGGNGFYVNREDTFASATITAGNWSLAMFGFY